MLDCLLVGVFRVVCPLFRYFAGCFLLSVVRFWLFSGLSLLFFSLSEGTQIIITIIVLFPLVMFTQPCSFITRLHSLLASSFHCVCQPPFCVFLREIRLAQFHPDDSILGVFFSGVVVFMLLVIAFCGFPACGPFFCGCS